MKTSLGDNVNLDGGVATRVEHLSRHDLADLAHVLDTVPVGLVDVGAISAPTRRA